MSISVVVATLNGREQLATTLDAITEHAPSTEVIVVNGPSSDGTSGMVRARPDVDVLVDVDERNINVARNAGLDRASHDVVAFLEYDVSVEQGWFEAIETHLIDVRPDDRRADAVTGPTHHRLKAGVTTEQLETRQICGRNVRYFGGGNVAVRRDALEALDGFDEALETGGARDAAHRLAALGYEVTWAPEMCVRTDLEADGGELARDWHRRYRSLVYRLVKNYGLRPTVGLRVLKHSLADGVDGLRAVLRGEGRPTAWVGDGRDVLAGVATGLVDGTVARTRNGARSQNPNGWTRRTDRAVRVDDRRRR